MPLGKFLLAAMALAMPVAASASSYVFEITTSTKRVNGAIVDFDPVTFTKEYTLLSPETFSDNEPSGDYYHEFFFTDIASPLVSVENDAYAAYLSYPNLSSGGPQNNAYFIDRLSAAPYRRGLISLGDYTVYTDGDFTATKTFESNIFKTVAGSLGDLSDLGLEGFNAFFKSGGLGFEVGANFTERGDATGTSNSGSLGFEGSARLLSIDGVPVVASVPEPATWAMMILGFGAAGALFRFDRRGKRRLAAA